MQVSEMLTVSLAWLELRLPLDRQTIPRMGLLAPLLLAFSDASTQQSNRQYLGQRSSNIHSSRNGTNHLSCEYLVILLVLTLSYAVVFTL